jgi:hypothetical protein
MFGEKMGGKTRKITKEKKDRQKRIFWEEIKGTKIKKRKVYFGKVILIKGGNSVIRRGKETKVICGTTAQFLNIFSRHRSNVRI